MYIYTVSRSIIYTDKGKADNPQTAERVFKMKKLILYRVDFDIKKFGEHHYFYYCYAHNAKQARSFAENEWYSTHFSHMFHISVSRGLYSYLEEDISTFYRVLDF